MASRNDVTAVTVISNPIIYQRFTFTVKEDTFNTDLGTEYEPSTLSLHDGLWQYKINSIYIDNFLTKLTTALPKIVFDIRTGLNRSYEKRSQSSFQPLYTTVMTVPLVTEERFFYMPNLNSNWYEISTRPYNNFFTKFELKPDFTKPKQTLRIEAQFLFQRIK